MVKEIIIFANVVMVTLVSGITRDALLAADFETIQDVGYYYFGSEKNWADAQKDCIRRGASLVVINSIKERDSLKDWLKTKTSSLYVYAGFTKVDDPTFLTVEGISLEDAGYSEWENGEPSGTLNLCGVIKTNGDLNAFRCDLPLSYVCEHQLWVDYEFFEGLGHYKMHTDGQSWIEASKTCRREGTHLVVLDSQEEADVIMGMYKGHPNLPNTDDANVAYIGFRAVKDDLSTDPWSGTYLTIFGTSVSNLGYVKWYSTEPQPGNKFFCGVLLRQYASYMMYTCSNKLAFFCEKELQGFIRP